MDWAKAFYGTFGAAYPTASLIGVCLLAAIVAGAGWISVANAYNRDHAAQAVIAGSPQDERVLRDVRARIETFIAEGKALQVEIQTYAGHEWGERRSMRMPDVRPWHDSVRDFLRRPPLGLSYVAAFDSGSIPSGTKLPPPPAMRGGPIPPVQNRWNLVTRDLAVLADFLNDPNLGR